MSTLPFSRFEITRFRGIRGLALEGLGRINLLVGANNSGKTSVLEAMSLCLAPLDPWTWIQTAQRREPGIRPRRTNVERLRWLFPQAESDREELYAGSIEIRQAGGGTIARLHASYQELRGTPAEESLGKNGLEEDVESDVEGIPEEVETEIARRGARVDVSVMPTGPYFDAPERSFIFWENERFMSRERAGVSLPTAYVTPYDHWMRALPASRFSEARRGGFEAEVVNLVRQLDDRILNVEVLAGRPSTSALRNEASLYLRDRTSGLLPVEAFGDGFRRALLMALSIPRAAGGGALFIDEIETAIHVSALTKLFRWLVNACHEHNVQLFVTTHSLEAIDAILDADPTSEEDIVAYRLERVGEETKARRYGEDLLKRLRFERGLEVR